MRSSILLCLVPVALCAAASPSPANVTISNAATANMTCSGGVCSPTAADAVLNVQELAAMLASGNATVTTTGSGVQATNIHVNAKLAWSAATTLALDAFRSIEVNAKVSVAGAGGVALTTNDGGGGGDFACNDKGRIEFSNLSSTLTINDTPYVIVNSVASLASAIAANPSGAFALAKNYNARKDGTYASSPIVTVFTGSFNGLGNSISNLSIDIVTGPRSVGLFSETSTGSIANIRLLNENVQAGMDSWAGGLVGWAIGGSITHTFTSGSITGGGDNYYLGGLIGDSGANVVASGSAMNVVATDGMDGEVGGLVGIGGPITDSYATGSVTDESEDDDVGGLVGRVYLSVKRSWASGAVSSSGGFNVGGLVGHNDGATIARSHASGNVTCQYLCGGLVGAEAGRISQSFATGSVSGGGVGGLVAVNYENGGISNSYSSGAVTGFMGGGSLAGGLVGKNFNGQGYLAISNSYSTGVVTDQGGYIGGLVGADEYTSTLNHTYWDMTTSGITDPGQGAGNIANDPGIKGLSDKKLKSGLPRDFDPKIWAEDSSINGGLPYLINNPPPN